MYNPDNYLAPPPKYWGPFSSAGKLKIANSFANVILAIIKPCAETNAHHIYVHPCSHLIAPSKRKLTLFPHGLDNGR